MVIVIKGWRRKMVNLAKILVVILAFAVLVPQIMAFLGDHRPVFFGWTKDETPTGNPMRVENNSKTKFTEVVDQFVVKLQDFYYQEKE
ncbi:MAG TPA: hypothetical protein PLE01_04180 [Syntrophothermus lipocalidus]|uniref:hypothetical protein n=1 Tax=Syntrophothermus sp. TaxID=2736299 RepID=UPI00257A7F12|nr:hypothetical protein [Syntrophothermus sp.]NSW82826.1 hypothetical protein [Syntrophothermus sp.]HOV43097.1 hypothetical protein [Syntrophothermus lipocalidus]